MIVPKPNICPKIPCSELISEILSYLSVLSLLVKIPPENTILRFEMIYLCDLLYHSTIRKPIIDTETE